MPQRQQTPEEWAYIVRAISNAQHMLSSLPRKPELSEPMAEQVKELDEALLLLGLDFRVDPLRPPIGRSEEWMKDSSPRNC